MRISRCFAGAQSTGINWFCLLVLLLPANLFSQSVESASNSNSQPLPQHALWRFGEADDIELPGYYLLKFSPDGRFLAARNRENIVEVRDCKTRKLVSEIGGHETKIRWLDFSKDGDYLLTAGDPSENVKIWEVTTGRLRNNIDCHPLFSRFSSDGKQIWVLDEIEPLKRTRLLKYDWPDALFSSHTDLRRNIFFHGAVSNSARFFVGAQQTRRKLSLPKLFDTLNDSAVILEGPSDPPQQVVFSNDDWSSFSDNFSLWMDCSSCSFTSKKVNRYLK